MTLKLAVSRSRPSVLYEANFLHLILILLVHFKDNLHISLSSSHSLYFNDFVIRTSNDHPQVSCRQGAVRDGRLVPGAATW